MFAEQHRDRVRFFARRAAGHPHANFVVRFLAREELRDVRLERSERLAIAEEMRHPDEQILEERASFRRMRADEIEIARDRFDRVHLHAPRDPPQHRRAFVMRKIVPGLRAHIGQHFADRLLILGDARYLRNRLAAGRFLLLRLRIVRLRNFRRQHHPVLVLDELEQLRPASPPPAAPNRPCRC